MRRNLENKEKKMNEGEDDKEVSAVMRVAQVLFIVLHALIVVIILVLYIYAKRKQRQFEVRF